MDVLHDCHAGAVRRGAERDTDLDKFDSSDGEPEGQIGAGQQSLAAVVTPQEAESGPLWSSQQQKGSAVEIASEAIAPAMTPMDEIDPQTSGDDSGGDYSSSLKTTGTSDSVTRCAFRHHGSSKLRCCVPTNIP